MTIKEIKDQFYMGSFGCADNPSCYLMQAEVYTEKICAALGKDKKQTKEIVRDMLGSIQSHVQKKLNGNKTVRIVFVNDWIDKYLLAA